MGIFSNLYLGFKVQVEGSFYPPPPKKKKKKHPHQAQHYITLPDSNTHMEASFVSLSLYVYFVYVCVCVRACVCVCVRAVCASV